MKIYRVAGVSLALAVGIWAALQAGDKKDSGTKATSTTAPQEAPSSLIMAADWTLNDLDGKPVKLSDYRGKVVVLDFWATWCPPCVQEIPHFVELQNEYAKKGVAVLSVSVDRKGADVVREFQAKTPMNYPVVMFTEAVYNQYQSYLPKDEQGGIPFTFIIDKEGKIRQHYVGYTDKDVFTAVIDGLK